MSKFQLSLRQLFPEHIQNSLSLSEIIITGIIKYVNSLDLLQTIHLRIWFSKKLIDFISFGFPTSHDLVCFMLVQDNSLEVLYIDKTLTLHQAHDSRNVVFLAPDEDNAILD